MGEEAVCVAKILPTSPISAAAEPTWNANLSVVSFQMKFTLSSSPRSTSNPALSDGPAPEKSELRTIFESPILTELLTKFVVVDEVNEVETTRFATVNVFVSSS